MGHNYGVRPRFLSITPTRDNIAQPGDRMPDKHSRLFHGKTLDEWTMIQLWSSKYAGRKVFVCETDEHARRLEPVADKYGVDILVRPREMLCSLNDTGGIPIQWAARRVLAEDYHTLITNPFVVSPCRPPGFFDMLVEQFQVNVGGVDNWASDSMVMGGYETDVWIYELDEHDIGTPLKIKPNKNPRARASTLQHYMALTHWWVARNAISDSRHDIEVKPVIVPIEPWMDCHIDTEAQWEEAEYWFAKKILNQGSDCYERYRETWNGS